MESPTVVLLAEGDSYWVDLKRTVAEARVVALCRNHGVRELWTADRDFSRFPDLRTRNPLV